MLKKVKEVVLMLLSILIVFFVAKDQEVAFTGALITFFLILSSDAAFQNYRKKERVAFLFNSVFALGFVVLFFIWLVDGLGGL